MWKRHRFLKYPKIGESCLSLSPSLSPGGQTVGNFVLHPPPNLISIAFRAFLLSFKIILKNFNFFRNSEKKFKISQKCLLTLLSQTSRFIWDHFRQNRFTNKKIIIETVINFIIFFVFVIISWNFDNFSKMFFTESLSWTFLFNLPYPSTESVNKQTRYIISNSGSILLGHPVLKYSHWMSYNFFEIIIIMYLPMTIIIYNL